MLSSHLQISWLNRGSRNSNNGNTEWVLGLLYIHSFTPTQGTSTSCCPDEESEVQQGWPGKDKEDPALGLILQSTSFSDESPGFTPAQQHSPAENQPRWQTSWLPGLILKAQMESPCTNIFSLLWHSPQSHCHLQDEYRQYWLKEYLKASYQTHQVYKGLVGKTYSISKRGDTRLPSSPVSHTSDQSHFCSSSAEGAPEQWSAQPRALSSMAISLHFHSWPQATPLSGSPWPSVLGQRQPGQSVYGLHCYRPASSEE